MPRLKQSDAGLAEPRPCYKFLLAIRSFKQRWLQRFFELGDARRVPQALAARSAKILLLLNSATELKTMSVPGYRLHPLKGKRAGLWSVRVSGNWRIVFRFENGDAYDVELTDYHQEEASET